MGDDRLYVIPIGDSVHVYAASQVHQARIVYTVAVGGNLDTGRYRIRADDWAMVLEQLPEDTKVADHRRVVA
jgi:hypothetical protein